MYNHPPVNKKKTKAFFALSPNDVIVTEGNFVYCRQIILRINISPGYRYLSIRPGCITD